MIGPGPAGETSTGLIEAHELSRLKDLIGNSRVGTAESCQTPSNSLRQRDSRISLVYGRGELQLVGVTAGQVCFHTESEGKARQILAEIEYLAVRYYPTPFPGKQGPGKEPDCTDGKCNPGKAGGKDGNFFDSFRLDCKYHGHGKKSAVQFCSAAAFYRADKSYYLESKVSIRCDEQTLYEGPGQIRDELTYDAMLPHDAAVPAIEVFPSQHLTIEGTYMSILDTSHGRIRGNCSVRRIGN